MNRLAHLNRLSQINSSKSIHFLTPIAQPGSHCPMHTAISLSAGIKGLSSIVIGSRECAYYSRNVPQVAEFVNGHHWSYVMDSDEVVFGCKDGLTDAIKQIDAAGAEAVALISTCVPEIIGDDIEGIIKEVQKQVKAKLLFMKVPQFDCNGSTTGGLYFYEAMLALMEKHDKPARAVNLLGFDPAEWRRSYEPKLLSLLKQNNIDLRYYFSSEASVTDYSKASEASFNIVFSIHNIGLARRMKEAFGIPYFIFQDIYSVNELDKALKMLEDTFNIELQSHFAAERAEAADLEKSTAVLVQGKSFIMTTPYRDTLPMAAYLCGLGMKPLLINADEYCPHNKRWTEQILAGGHDPYLCHMVNEPADAEVLNTVDFDICIGKFKYIEGGRPCLQDMSGLLLKYDYSRTSALLAMLTGGLNGAV